MIAVQSHERPREEDEDKVVAVPNIHQEEEDPDPPEWKKTISPASSRGRRSPKTWLPAHPSRCLDVGRRVPEACSPDLCARKGSGRGWTDGNATGMEMNELCLAMKESVCRIWNI